MPLVEGVPWSARGFPRDEPTDQTSGFRCNSLGARERKICFSRRQRCSPSLCPRCFPRARQSLSPLPCLAWLRRGSVAAGADSCAARVDRTRDRCTPVEVHDYRTIQEAIKTPHRSLALLLCFVFLGRRRCAPIFHPYRGVDNMTVSGPVPTARLHEHLSQPLPCLTARTGVPAYTNTARNICRSC